MSNSETIIYQTDDGQTKTDVRLQDEAVWLSQAQRSKFFQKDRSVIGKYINNIFEEGELNGIRRVAKKIVRVSPTNWFTSFTV